MRIDRRGFMASAAALPIGAALPGMAMAGAGARRYKACVIGDSTNGGYGHRFHQVWATREDVEVVAVADPDEDGRKRHVVEAKAQRGYADFEEMLEQEKPDLVTVAPRTTVNHRKYLLACAAAGAHGMMEKPIATDLAEADAMVDAIEAKGLKWGMGFNFRATPVMQHAKRMILEEGIIGEILELRGRGKEDRRAGGEDLIVLGTHSFDLMIDFLGKPAWCSADVRVGTRPAAPGDVREATEPLGPVVGDRLQATFGFPNGVYAYFSTVRTRDGNGGRWGVDVYGTKGIVTIRMTEIPEVRLLRQSDWTTADANARWEAMPEEPTMDPATLRARRYAPIVDDVLACIGTDRTPDVSLQAGRASYEMIQAVFASCAAGGRVKMPLKERAHPLKEWS